LFLILMVMAVVAGLAAKGDAGSRVRRSNEGRQGVQVVFSDDLGPDKSVPIRKVAGTKLTF
jgi:hypothetical protein